MDTRISFGECLKQLLLIREWPASKLAREINIEPSYIRMWLRGERVPSIQSDHVKMITAALVNGLDTIGKKSVCDLYCEYLTHIGVENDGCKALPELVESVLESAQIYSLSLKPKRKTVKKNLHGMMAQKNTAEVIKNLSPKGNPVFPRFDDIPPLIRGRYSILCAMLAALQSAIDNQCNSPGEIFMTYQSKSHLFSGYPVLYKLWNSMLSEALNKNWQVRHLYRMDINAEHSYKMAEELINCAGFENNFFPYFFPKYGMVQPPMEITVIKEAGAFILMPAESDNSSDEALFFKKKDVLNTIYKYSMRMCRDANFMLKYFPDFMEYIGFLALECRKKGSFYTVSLDLHFSTIPLLLWKKFLSFEVDDQLMREQCYRRITELNRVFHEDVKRFKVKHICQIEIIEWMVESQEYFCRYFSQKATPEDILAHLEYTIHLLKTYENFEIGLVSESHNSITIPVASWEVRGESSIGIITVDMKEHTNFVYLTVSEETIAGTFNDYFLDLWEKITPKYRNKAFVVSWFEEKALHLKNKMRHLQ